MSQSQQRSKSGLPGHPLHCPKEAMRASEGMGLQRGDPGYEFRSESRASARCLSAEGEDTASGELVFSEQVDLCCAVLWEREQLSMSSHLPRATSSVGFGELACRTGLSSKTGSWAVRTGDVVSAPGGRGQSMDGIEKEKELGHRKTQVFGVRLMWVQDPELPLTGPAL